MALEAARRPAAPYLPATDVLIGSAVWWRARIAAGDVAHAKLGGLPDEGVAMAGIDVPWLPGVAGVRVVGAVLVPSKQVERTASPGEEFHGIHGNARSEPRLAQDVVHRLRCAADVVDIVEQDRIGHFRQFDRYGLESQVTVAGLMLKFVGSGSSHSQTTALWNRYMAAVADQRELAIWLVSKCSSRSGSGSAARTSGGSWPIRDRQ